MTAPTAMAMPTRRLVQPSACVPAAEPPMIWKEKETKTRSAAGMPTRRHGFSLVKGLMLISRPTTASQEQSGNPGQPGARGKAEDDEQSGLNDSGDAEGEFADGWPFARQDLLRDEESGSGEDEDDEKRQASQLVVEASRSQAVGHRGEGSPADRGEETAGARHDIADRHEYDQCAPGCGLGNQPARGSGKSMSCSRQHTHRPTISAATDISLGTDRISSHRCLILYS